MLPLFNPGKWTNEHQTRSAHNPTLTYHPKKTKNCRRNKTKKRTHKETVVTYALAYTFEFLVGTSPLGPGPTRIHPLAYRVTSLVYEARNIRPFHPALLDHPGGFSYETGGRNPTAFA